MKTEFTISLTEGQAQALEAACAARPGVSPEVLIAAWAADMLDLERLSEERGQHSD